MQRRRFGLIGFPLGHSFSSTYFSTKFALLGLEGFTYQNFQIADPNDLALLLRSDLFGVNVTHPYKSVIIPFLNEVDRDAWQVNAVNTVVRTGDNSWKGYNTDIPGFRDSLLDFYEGTDLPEQALILGTGGAARAVQWVLVNMGIQPAMVSRKGGVEFTYGQLTPEIIRTYRLIINATPLGTAPAEDQAPSIPYEGMTREHMLFDLVYNPANTLFLTRGQQMGARIRNGLDMLHRQAEYAWAIWKSYGTF